jgi:hypothetical protein
MKTKTLITACFAGVGIYLIISGAVSVIASFYMVFVTFSDQLNRTMALLQFLVLSMPFISGLVFFGFARLLADVVCRRSSIDDSEPVTALHPTLAITTACVICGLMLALGQVPEFAQALGKQFLAAASPVYAANHQGEDYRILMIRPGVYSAVAIVLLWKAKALGSWLVSRYEKP